MKKLLTRLTVGVVVLGLSISLLPSLSVFADDCPCSVFAPTDTPATANTPDNDGVEVGMKFRSGVEGTIDVIRFYKGSTNTGTHVGNLWTASGTNLASVTFTGETASGWQEAALSSPVSISPNTTYVVSYHAPNGSYSSNGAYFTSAKESGPLTGLASGTDGSNGVYKYGTSSAFPDQSYNNTNYWVDVVFSPVEDETAPTVTSVSPANTSTTAGTGTNVTANFSEAIDPDSLTASSFELRDPGNTIVPSAISYNAASAVAMLNPDAELTASTTYTATLKGGSGSGKVTDNAGNPLAADYAWTFTTGTTYCGTMNPIACENTREGNPASEWDLGSETAGDSSIQGYATDASVNVGSTINFKVKTPSTDYKLDIYRMGYYDGDGARKVATVQPSATLPQTQPDCLTESSTGLIDCGNWAASASWAVPSTAVSGVYVGKLVREDATGASHIIFVVRNDSSTAGVLYQTSDTTWGAAYNDYGGNSLYTGSPAGRAYKVSLNRPLNTRNNIYKRTHFFANEQPMIRWMERNGYDMAYSSGVDTERRAATAIQQHDVFISSGHDEYWSATQRANVEAAREAGVHLAFFSGNEVFWKTRWENSTDSSNTPYRTLVTYKETLANDEIDPSSEWTGTWRDPRFGNTTPNGAYPENSLTGTIFTANCCTAYSVKVPEEDGKMRFWRNTSVANLQPNNTATLTPGTVGFEFDEDLDNGFRPAGLIRMSSGTYTGISKLQDHGGTYSSGTATHSITLYKDATNGALVFGAGTVRWAWGLDGTHDDSASAPTSGPDVAMQQATVNLFADMGVQPTTLQSGLSAASASTDTTAPTSAITSPAANATVNTGSLVTITGTASDSGGKVGGVEVSVDGGSTWRRATGRDTWSYSTTFTSAGTITLKTRAADDSGNIEAPGSGRSITVEQSEVSEYTVFSPLDTPAVVPNESDPIELGMKFRSSTAGTVTGIRFYKDTNNTGTHIGNLWDSSGNNLATVTFTNETSSGWQQATLSSPVSISANTTYVVSYFAPNGHFGMTLNYFTSGGTTNGPLTALANGTDGSNGVFKYNSSSVFPDQSHQASNYWVDVVVTNESLPPDTEDPSTPANLTATNTSGHVELTWTASTDNVGVAGYKIFRGGNQIATSSTASYTDTTVSPSTAYAYTVQAYDAATNTSSNSNTANITTPSSGNVYTILQNGTPQTSSVNEAHPLEVGVKFRSSTAGNITGVRFYKDSTNTGTHIGNLWDSSGNNLATVTFTNETSSGWQEATFSTPVAISANTTYVVSYFAPNGNFSRNLSAFASSGITNGPLTALANGVDGDNGVFKYNSSSVFPDQSYQSSNYWVDVMFEIPVYSILSASGTPTNPSVSDTGAVELGLKFRSNIAKNVTGVKFYKGTNNTGTHIGRLWSSGGTLLGTATFSNETSTGWQTAYFPSPIPISANTTYVMSYHAPNGGYAGDNSYFASSGVTNGPLTALANGVDGDNGVFAYGTSGTFPNQSYQSTNYWVDVVVE